MGLQAWTNLFVFLLPVALGFPRYILYRESPTDNAILYLPQAVIPSEEPAGLQKDLNFYPEAYPLQYATENLAATSGNEPAWEAYYHDYYIRNPPTADNTDLMNNMYIRPEERPVPNGMEGHVSKDEDIEAKEQYSSLKRSKRQVNPFQVGFTDDGGLSFTGALSNSFSAALGNAAGFGSGNSGAVVNSEGAGSGSTSNSGASSASPFGFGAGGNVGLSFGAKVHPFKGVSLSASNSLSNSASYNVLGLGNSFSDSQSNSFSTDFKPQYGNYVPSRPSYNYNYNPYRGGYNRRGYRRNYGRRYRGYYRG